MNKVFRLTVLSALCIFSSFLESGSSFAQDIHFSQFYVSQLITNPATAGALKEITATLNYRDQWRSVTSPYKTFAGSYDMRIFKDRWRNVFLGWGLDVYNDAAGDGNMRTTQADLSFASHVRVSDHQIISAGVMGGFGQRSINYSALTWGAQYDGTILNSSLPSGEPGSSASFVYPDFGAGVLYQFSRDEGYTSANDKLQANVGFSVSHINQPKVSFYSRNSDILYMKYALHGNMFIGIRNSPLSIVPGFVFYLQGPSQEKTGGTMIRYAFKEESKYTSNVNGIALSVGAYYRWSDAIIVSSLLEIANYAVGVSYDVNVSQLRSSTKGFGGAEISLRFIRPSNFRFKNRARF